MFARLSFGEGFPHRIQRFFRGVAERAHLGPVDHMGEPGPAPGRRAQDPLDRIAGQVASQLVTPEAPALQHVREVVEPDGVVLENPVTLEERPEVLAGY